MTNDLSPHTQLFDRMFRVSPEAKEALIQWLVKCFHSNTDRDKMANRIDPRASLMAALSTASDGFFLNLSWVLLRLCAPFSREGGAKRTVRVASIDPTYCIVGGRTGSSVGGVTVSSVVDFKNDTKLVSGMVAYIYFVLCTVVYIALHDHASVSFNSVFIVYMLYSM